MKQKYVHPELEVTKLTTEDILSASSELDKEVEIDGGDLFN